MIKKYLVKPIHLGNNNQTIEGCSDLNCCDDVTKPYGM